MLRALLCLAAAYARTLLACHARVLYAVINSGQNVSGTVDISQFAAPSNVQFPVLTAAESGDFFLKGSFDNSQFMRMMESRQVTSGFFRMPVGIGSMMFPMPTAFAYPPYIQFEAATAVAAPRTLTILARNWQY